MNETARLLDAARKTLDCNDSELARHLKISKSLISEYRKGTRPIPDQLAIQLARLVGEEPARVLPVLHAERTQGPAAEVWKDIARRISSSSLALFLAAGSIGPPLTQAVDQMSIMSTRRKQRKTAYQTPSVWAHLKSQGLAA